MNAASSIYILFALTLVVSCGPTQYSSAADPYLGIMTDLSYGGLVTPGAEVRRLNANGSAVSMNQFAGRFVWADYAAPWCQPCVSQSQAIAALEKSNSSKIIYLTVLTSKSAKYNDVPDVSSAKSWARRFGLEGDRVLVATNLWSGTIPHHILFSPDGQMLYKSTGVLSGAQIQSTASRFIKDWTAWKETGSPAPWMK